MRTTKRLIDDDDVRESLEKRIIELDQKLAEMRRPDGPDFNPSDMMRGRVQGQIGELTWLLTKSR